MNRQWDKKFSHVLLGKLLPKQHFPQDISRFREFIRFSIVLKEMEPLNLLSYFERGIKVAESVRKAIESYGRELQPEEKILLVKILREECWIFRILGDIKKSKASAKKALEILGEIEEKVLGRKYLYNLIASVKNNLAITLYTQGEIDKAIGLWNESKEHYEAIGNDHGMRMIYNYFGTAYKHRGEFEKAVKMYEKLLKASEKATDLKEMGVAYVNLGATYIDQKKYAKAEKFLKKALDIHEKMGNQHGVGIVYSNLGLIHDNLQEYDKAEEMYAKNLEIAEKTGYLLGIGIASANLGLVHHAKGDLKKAEKGYRRYLQINEEMKNQRGIGIGSMYLGGLCSQLNKFKQAASYLKRAEEILTKLGDWSFLPILYKKLTYLKLDTLNSRNLKDAADYLKQLKQIAKNRKSEKFEFLALVLEAGIKAYGDDWKEADRCFEKAVKFFERTGDKQPLAYSYSMYGKVNREKGLKDKARKNLGKAYKLFKELKLIHKVK